MTDRSVRAEVTLIVVVVDDVLLMPLFFMACLTCCLHCLLHAAILMAFLSNDAGQKFTLRSQS